MRSLQQKIMKDLNVQSEINAQEEIEKRVQFLKDYVKKQKQKDSY